jgi:hypothetical protein
MRSRKRFDFSIRAQPARSRHYPLKAKEAVSAGVLNRFEDRPLTGEGRPCA